MKIVRFTLLMLLLSTYALRAQDTFHTSQPSRLAERLAVKVEYFGELVLHPGMSMGMEYTVASNRWITLHWNADIGGYWHRWNNTSVFLKTSFGTRFALGSVFANINLGVGYMHSWAAGEIYQKDQNGGVEKAANRGHAHFMPNASFLIGWNGSRKNLPWSIHFGPEIYLQSSYNHIFLPQVAAKIGFTYQLNAK